MASDDSKYRYFSEKYGQPTEAELEFIEENAIDGSGQKERPSPTDKNASKDKRTVSAQLVRDVILDNFEDANMQKNYSGWRRNGNKVLLRNATIVGHINLKKKRSTVPYAF